MTEFLNLLSIHFQSNRRPILTLMWFKSNAALERHKNLVHTEGHDNQNLRNKKCPKCDVLYPSQYYLNRHLRDDHGHVPTKGRGRPKKSQN